MHLFPFSPTRFRNLPYRIWRRSARLVSKSFSDFPNGIIESERRHLLLVAPQHLVSVDVVDTARIVPVRSIGPAFASTLAFSERLAFDLRDVTVDPATGAVCLGKSGLLGTSIGSISRVVGWGRVTPTINGPVRMKVEKTPCVVFPSLSYFHWLTEAVPPVLSALARFPELTIITHPNAAPYVWDFLRMVKEFRKESVKVIVTSGRVWCENVHFLPRPSDPTQPYPYDIALLKEAFFAASSNSCPRDRQIYVSRKFASRRPFNEESRLESLLESNGFSVVHLETMSLREQVETMQRARFVTGFHGAGLANLVWCRPGTTALEIFAANPHVEYFRNLSNTIGIDYRHLSVNGQTLENLVAAIVEYAEP